MKVVLLQTIYNIMLLEQIQMGAYGGANSPAFTVFVSLYFITLKLVGGTNLFVLSGVTNLFVPSGVTKLFVLNEVTKLFILSGVT